jgi:hypothetical protein
MTLKANTTSIKTTSPCSKKFVDLIIWMLLRVITILHFESKERRQRLLNNNDGNVNSTLLHNLAL